MKSAGGWSECGPECSQSYPQKLRTVSLSQLELETDLPVTGQCCTKEEEEGRTGPTSLRRTGAGVLHHVRLGLRRGHGVRSPTIASVCARRYIVSSALRRRYQRCPRIRQGRAAVPVTGCTMHPWRLQTGFAAHGILGQESAWHRPDPFPNGKDPPASFRKETQGPRLHRPDYATPPPSTHARFPPETLRITGGVLGQTELTLSKAARFCI